MFTLRDYQKEAVEACLADMKLKGNSIIVLPTGAGKSLVVAECVNRINEPCLILQPSKEILEQNVSKMLNYVPRSQVGIYSASAGEKTIRKFTFATIQSIYQIPERFQHFRVVFVDECHGVNVKNKDSMYKQFFDAIKQPKVIGLTATPYRNMVMYHHDKNSNLYSANTLKLVNRVKPKFWERIIYNVNNWDLVKAGYLSKIEYFDKSKFSHKDIPLNKSRSDFDTEKFAKKLESQNNELIDLFKRAVNARKSVLVFCGSLAQAKSFHTAMKADGYESAYIDGKMRTDDREYVINGFRDGSIKIVFNMEVLTTGFDHPELDTIFMLRPTRSLAKWYQMAGRGVRIASGKESCVLVDFTSNVKEMGRIESIKLVEEKRMFDYSPMWYLTTETGNDWHGKELYRFQVS